MSANDFDLIAKEMGMPMESNLRELQKRAYATSKKSGFHEHGDEIRRRLAEVKIRWSHDDTSPELDKELEFWEDTYRRYLGNCLMLIAGEVSEGHEEIRDGRDPDETYYSMQDWGMKPEGLPSELADVLIRVLDTAEELGIDMVHEVNLKMLANAQRPYKHGKTL